MSRRISVISFTTRHSHLPIRPIRSHRDYSDSSSKDANTNAVGRDAQKPDAKSSEELKPKKKTQAELDAELMEKLQGLDSEGGAAGVEYEDGKPASMKRSVRNNMFRYI